jgi:hypothetical protein
VTPGSGERTIVESDISTVTEAAQPCENSHSEPDPEALKEEILQAIVEHLQTHGACKWNLLRENPRYVDIIGSRSGTAADRRFWRWRKAISRRTPNARTKPFDGRGASDRHGEWSADAARQAGGDARSVAPYLRQTGARGLQKLSDLGVLVREVLEDADRIRDSGFMPDAGAPGGASVFNSLAVHRGGKQKLEVVKIALALYREIERLSEKEEFYEGLYEILDEELRDHPELLNRISDRFERLMLNLGRGHGGNQ